MKHLRKKEKGESGVISLEACISVPIFLLILMFFYGVMVTFTGEHLIKHTMIQCAESLSLDPYATEKFKIQSFDELISGDSKPEIKEILLALYGQITGSGKNQYYSSGSQWYKDPSADVFKETIKNRFLGYIAGSADNVEEQADAMLKEIGVVDGINGVDFSESTIDGKTLTIVIKYKQEFVFNFQGLAAFDRKLSVTVDMWGLSDQ